MDRLALICDRVAIAYLVAITAILGLAHRGARDA
jgi:hypothetical protein